MSPTQAQDRDERQPLLPNRALRTSGHRQDGSDRETVRFEKEDPENPRNWPYRRKLINVAVISSMSFLSPLASAAFTPAISAIANDLGTDTSGVIGATSGFVATLGVGPLVLAPLSETFGRRNIYLVCFVAFTLLQIPTALSPNLECLIITRTLAGFFGSVGIANGGGTISDMFPPSERATVFGIYLLGVLLGPSIGPLMGGITVQFADWRAIFWVIGVLSVIVTVSSFLFLKESYAPAILALRKRSLQKEHPESGPYSYEGEDPRPIYRKVARNIWRPLLILTTQPIVLAMSTYQAILWSCNYSLITQFEQIFANEPYNFKSYQVGLMYMPMGAGLLLAAIFLVPKIDTVYNRLTEKHDGQSKPEFRLPLANIGAVLMPICLFVFAWSIQFKVHWAVIFVLLPYGLGQVTIFNCTQNYYIDSFEKFAASAIAAGSLFRSIVGAIVPILIPGLVQKVGYGWAISVFGFASLALAPFPILFYRYGPALRQRFKLDL